MKNNLRKITYIFIIFLILISIKNVYAATEEELKNKENEINEKINQTHTEIAGVQDEMTATLDQITRLNIQIKEHEEALEEANSDLEKITKELEEKQKELDEAQQNYEKQKKILDARLIAIYESSKTTYLDILVGSKDISDFLSKYYMLQQIAEYDDDLMDSLKIAETIVEVENSELEKKEKEIKTTKNRLEAKQGSMEVLIKDKNNLIENLSEEEKTLNDELEQFELDKKQIEKELKEIAMQNAIKASVTPSNCGYISPLLGKTKANITTGYYGYSGHTGVDFAISSGTEILAVKSGTVVVSNALKNSNGNYRSYGEHIVIDHHDGTMTLYAHGLPDSRKVDVGDTVEQGQCIMLVGSTGNSTGPHLHFEVRINGKCVEPSEYLP